MPVKNKIVFTKEDLLDSGNKEISIITQSMNNDIFNSVNSLEEFNSLINECKKCPLGNSRKKFVFGAGNPDANLMIIGEAPGADEDIQGEPFVGRAGKLLTDILIAIQFKREEVFIANILKCRPPNNRNPLPAEMEQCLPYLYKQIELIKPKVILCLGLVAANSLLKNKLSLTQMRGNVYELNGVKVMVTYHPAALLRNPGWKRGCWEDVQKLRKLYDELVP
ncbi:MAG: uracil-DNA glycosylase [Ignavibacteria bacterium]|nr:uracil-DNA glycosylase [Ignavibacteria bacterium]